MTSIQLIMFAVTIGAWVCLSCITVIVDCTSLASAPQLWSFIWHYPLLYFGVHFALIYPLINASESQFSRKFWQVSIPVILVEFFSFLYPHSPASFLVTALRLSFLITVFQYDSKRLSAPLVLFATSVQVVASGYFLTILSFFVPVFVSVGHTHPVGLVFAAILFGIPLTILFAHWTAYSEYVETIAKKYDFNISKHIPIIFVSLLFVSVSIVTKPNTPYIVSQASLPNHGIPELELETALLDAYLSRNNYLFDHQVVVMQELYGKHIGLVLDPLFRLVMYPLIYNGYFPSRDKAAILYENYFDRSLEKTHADTLRNVLGRPRWDVGAQISDIDRNAVHMKKQEIKITETHNFFASVEIHEVFQSVERNEEEVFYYFQMPESAVFTGLWLSDQPNKEMAFKYRVSPRGAAQQVYKEQVKRTQDPALLEQVGPRQYRMRVFPILRDVESHLWYTYDVLKIEGEWALPKIVEKRNVYWDYSTVSSLNGEVLNIGSIYNWKGDYLKAKSSENSLETLKSELDIEGLKIAVIIDTSYSMRSVKNQLENTLEFFRSKLNKNTIHTFVSANDNVIKTDEIPHNLHLVGFRSNYHMLSQYSKHSSLYDVSILLTDKGSFELSENHKEELNISHPVYIVHLDEISIGYEDKTLKLLDRGGIATSAQEALQKFLVKRQGDARLVDGYIWKVDTTQEPTNPIAAKQIIFNILDSRKPNLEEVHKLAVRHSLVTPYSSMIVLVNYQQHKLLDELEQKDDKFDREIEDGKRVFQYSLAKQLGIPLLLILVLLIFVM